MRIIEKARDFWHDNKKTIIFVGVASAVFFTAGYMTRTMMDTKVLSYIAQTYPERPMKEIFEAIVGY